MKMLLPAVLALVFVSCRPRDFDAAETKGVTVTRIAKIEALPKMEGCFRIAMVKIRDLATSVPKTFFQQHNCDFMGENTNAASSIKKDWNTAKQQNALSGCLLAFQPLSSEISFSYSLIMRTAESGVTTGSWNENPLTSGDTRKETDSQGGLIMITPERKNFTGRTVFEALGQGNGRAYLNNDSSSDARDAKIVVEFKNNTSSVLKYYGHVVENIPCSGK